MIDRIWIGSLGRKIMHCIIIDRLCLDDACMSIEYAISFYGPICTGCSFHALRSFTEKFFKYEKRDTFFILWNIENFSVENVYLNVLVLTFTTSLMQVMRKA